MTYRNAAKLGKKAVVQAVKQVERDLKSIAKNLGPEAKHFLSAVIAEAKEEKARIARFAKQEWRKEVGKAKPALRKTVKKWTR